MAIPLTGGPAPWKKDDVIEAARLNESQRVAITEIRVGPGLNIIRNGNQVSITVVRFIAAASGLYKGKVYKTGGAAGSSSTYCTFVYTVKDRITDEVLGEELAPQKLRPLMAMVAPADGADCLYGYDEDGAIFLWDANEVIWTKPACTT